MKSSVKTLMGSIILASTLAMGQAFAGDIKVKIEDPWSRQAEGMGAGFMKITNEGKEDVTLQKAASDISKSVEVHETIMEKDKEGKDVMKMREAKDGIVIKPGATLTLKPGSYHIMFIGLKNPLKANEKFDVKLSFTDKDKAEKTETVNIKVLDDDAALAKMDGDKSAMMGHDHASHDHSMEHAGHDHDHGHEGHKH